MWRLSNGQAHFPASYAMRKVSRGILEHFPDVLQGTTLKEILDKVPQEQRGHLPDRSGLRAPVAAKCGSLAPHLTLQRNVSDFHSTAVCPHPFCAVKMSLCACFSLNDEIDQR